MRRGRKRAARRAAAFILAAFTMLSGVLGSYQTARATSIAVGVGGSGVSGIIEALFLLFGVSIFTNEMVNDSKSDSVSWEKTAGDVAKEYREQLVNEYLNEWYQWVQSHGGSDPKPSPKPTPAITGIPFPVPTPSKDEAPLTFDELEKDAEETGVLKFDPATWEVLTRAVSNIWDRIHGRTNPKPDDAYFLKLLKQLPIDVSDKGYKYYIVSFHTGSGNDNTNYMYVNYFDRPGALFIKSRKYPEFERSFYNFISGYFNLKDVSSYKYLTVRCSDITPSRFLEMNRGNLDVTGYKFEEIKSISSSNSSNYLLNFTLGSYKSSYSDTELSKYYYTNMPIFENLQDAKIHCKENFGFSIDHKKEELYTVPSVQNAYKNGGKLPVPSSPPAPIRIPTREQLYNTARKLNPEINTDYTPEMAPKYIEELQMDLTISPEFGDGTDPIPEFGGDPGTDPGTNPDTDSGTDPGTDPGIGTNPAPGPNPDLGSDPVPDTGFEEVPVPDDSSEGDVDPESYKTDLQSLFPFCIPFDLIHLVKAFSADPVAPVFDIPIDLTLRNPFNGRNVIDYHDVWRLDFADFEPAVKMFRLFQIVFFVIGLMMITRQQMIKG